MLDKANSRDFNGFLRLPTMKDASVNGFFSPIARPPATARASAPPRRLDGALFRKHITYKVIIRIRLSARGWRYMLEEWRLVGRLNDLTKGAKYVLDDTGYCRSVRRHGSHKLRVCRILTASATRGRGAGVLRVGVLGPRGAA